MKMDAQYFIDKFEAIPEEEWTVGIAQNTNNSRCAVGHCCSEYLDQRLGQKVQVLPTTFPQGSALLQLFHTHLRRSVVHVNDGKDSSHKQPTPKQRVLAALRDIQTKEQQDKAVEEVKEVLAQETELV